MCNYAVMAQLQNVRFVMERLLVPGLIPKLAVHRCIFEKALYEYFLLGPGSLSFMVAHSDERLANGTQKVCLLASMWLGS